MDKNKEEICKMIENVYGENVRSWRSRKNWVRYKKAEEQFDMEVKRPQEIYIYVKEYLVNLGLDTTKFDNIEAVQMKPPTNDDYNYYINIKNKFDLDDERDIIWMKFTKKGHLGVVATSNDINFDIPIEFCDSAQQNKKGKWLFNFSGVLVKYLNEKWNEDYVLIFPLSRISSTRYTRHEIEKMIGNYLIDKGVPILDFYSHRI